MTTINVTAEHIAMGERSSCTCCPVALATRAAFPAASYIWVGGAGLLMTIDGHDIERAVPGEVEDFIHAFDDGYDVEPLSFEVDYPAVAS